MRTTSIHQHFADVKDPRINRTKKHQLINIIFIALCAVICGAEDFASIERFGKVRKKWFKRFLDLTHGIPSHDTFNRVFAVLEPEVFSRAFRLWVEQIAEKVKKVIALDGKSLRATKSDVNKLGALHMVNVWCCENQLCLGQQAVEDKSNEITAIPLLLDMLDIQDAIITIDAMGCQKNIGEKIRDKGADYVLSLKANQGNLQEDVSVYFQSLSEKKLKEKTHHYQTLEKNHGRIEERNYWSVALPKGLHSEGFKDLNTLAMVRAKRIVGEKESVETRYFISSIASTEIRTIAEAIRTHWQVENNLHWQLDVSFNEDRWKAKMGNTAKNIAFIHKMALTLLSQEQTAKVGMKNRRLLAGWDTDYLEKVLLKSTRDGASSN